MNLRTKSQKGFTIVELLIVIVVIAILAAISIVAYTGVQNNARLTQYQADAKTVIDAANAYNAEHGTFPTHAQLGSYNTVKLSSGVLTKIGTDTPNTTAPSDTNKEGLRYTHTATSATVDYYGKNSAGTEGMQTFTSGS